MLFNRKFKRRSTVIMGVVAGLSFVALAVYGWGVPAKEVASFFIISVLFLALILITAMALGMLMVCLRKVKKDRSE